MTSYKWRSALVLATILNAAALNTAGAQTTNAANTTQPNYSTNGPAGTYSRTQTTKTLDAAGTIRSTTKSFDKSQSYTSGNGSLSAKTSIKSTGPATTTTHLGTSTP